MRIGDGEEATYKCMYELLEAGFFKATLCSTKSAELKQQGRCAVAFLARLLFFFLCTVKVVAFM